MLRIHRLSLAVLGLAMMLAQAAAGQPAGCKLPLPQARQLARKDIFSDQQENWLGEVLTERLQGDFNVVRDPELNRPLQQLGERLLSHMPATRVHFQFALIDSPEVNAFSLPGGYVYVTRKLVSFARNEDELAAVLGHEMGHIFTHQGAITMTQLFNQVLGVTSVTDKADIAEKYNQLLESIQKKDVQINDDESQDQLVADRIGVYALALSGYDPRSFSGFWDRFAATKGKTGSFWSDFFGTTSFQSRRLRDMMKEAQHLPPGCQGAATPAKGDFAAWQKKVIAYEQDAEVASLHSVVEKISLEPALRDELSYVRFSPDKEYIMAQDDAGIFILRTEPLTFLFHIDAADAREAKFSPDSKTVSFATDGLRVETWDLQKQKRTLVAEVANRGDCVGMDFSPDGKYLACVNLVESRYAGTVRMDFTVFDTATNEVFYEKKGFYTIFGQELFDVARQILLEDSVPQLFTIHFSPAGKYVIAAREKTVIALDVSHKTLLDLDSSFRNLLSNSFTFVGNDRILGLNYNKPEESALVRFPSGEVITRLAIGRQAMKGATKGDYVMMRPIQDYPVGVMDLNKKSLVVGYKRTAFDLYDNLFVTDTPASEVQLGRLNGEKVEPLGLVALPRGPLADVRTFALAGDDRYLALAEKTQGAVWDLTKHQRVLHMRGFQGAYLGEGSRFYALFPKLEQRGPQMAVFDLHSGSALGIAALHEEEHPVQYGPVFIVKRPKKKDVYTSQVTWEFHDVRTGKKLWERYFGDDIPYLTSIGKSTVFRWILEQKEATSIVHHDPKLSALASHISGRENSYLLEFVDTNTGAMKGRLLIDTGNGSFRVRTASLEGDWVLVTDNLNRTLLYSLESGKQEAHFFGNHPLLLADKNLLLLQNDQNELQVMDIKTGARKDRFVFPSPIAVAAAGDPESKLFVLTKDQTVFWIDLPSAESATKVSVAPVR